MTDRTLRAVALLDQLPPDVQDDIARRLILETVQAGASLSQSPDALTERRAYQRPTRSRFPRQATAYWR